eukprot:scaffold91735_cov60-Phaeocystis_antarctica.AAC.5
MWGAAWGAKTSQTNNNEVHTPTHRARRDAVARSDVLKSRVRRVCPTSVVCTFQHTHHKNGRPSTNRVIKSSARTGWSPGTMCPAPRTTTYEKLPTARA